MATSTETSKQHAIATARRFALSDIVYLDTETTGIGKTDEVVEISIVDAKGNVEFSSLVRPKHPISPSATAIHGITNTDVQSSPYWYAVFSEVRAHLFGRVVAGYNISFDVRLMMQSHAQYGLQWNLQFSNIDVMQLFSDYRTTWDSYRKSFKFFKLEEAGRFLNIDISNTHRSTDDARLTRAVMLTIAGMPY